MLRTEGWTRASQAGSWRPQSGEWILFDYDDLISVLIKLPWLPSS